MTFQQRRVGAEVARGAARDAVLVILLAAEREAKRLVPRDTSNLAGSLGTEVTVVGEKATGTLGTNVEYAAPVEFGTHSAGEPDAPGKVSWAPGGMPPRPYLRPGLRAGVLYARAKGVIK